MKPLFALAALMLPGLATAQVKVVEPPVEAPYSLTAADGTGLELVELDARAIVDGPLAFTELRLVFRNPQPRVIEGHFKVTMPDDAAISRFAMKIRGAWMEGEVVEKQAARRAYEDALHRRQDPALLEQDGGNQFRARVFPIPANGTKSLIISWSHELKTAGESYRMPLAGLPKVQSLKLASLTAGPGIEAQTSLGGKTARYKVTSVEKTNYQPTEDWVVFGGVIPADGDALRADNLAVSRFVVPGDLGAKSTTKGAVLLVDTSASRAVNFEGRLAALQTLVEGLPGVGIETIEVIAFDQSARTVYSGAVAGFGAKALADLRQRGALGASNLSAALAAAALTKGEGRRLIVLSDGMLTAGERDLEALSKSVAGLASVGITRADVLVDTTARDPLVLEALVQSELPNAGQVIEARQPLKAQLERLGRVTLKDLKISVAGSEWVWPASARGLQPGDALVVFADLKKDKPLAITLSGGLDATIKPTVRTAERPLLERAWVAARIRRLQKMRAEGDPDMRGAFKTQILELSTKYRVLSPFTALVVLETEADYARFGIDRKALAEIMTVGTGGIELLDRKMLKLPPPPPPPPKPKPRPRKGKMKKMAEKKSDRAKADDADGFADMEMEAEKSMEEATGEGDGAPAERAEPAPQDAPSAEPPPAAAPRANAAPRRPRPVRVAADEVPQAKVTGESQGRRELREIEAKAASLTGKMAIIDGDLKAGRIKKALAAAKAWRDEAPTDLLALIALGRSYNAAGNLTDAARAFGSILDLYPSRADMRRLAGNWLESLGKAGWALAVDTYTVALEQRPDHPSVYHQLAMVLVRLGRYDEALEVALTGINARRISNRFQAVDRILAEDAQIIAAAFAAQAPKQRKAIAARLSKVGLKIDTEKTLRFVLTWETDANDVDFHIFDKRFNHAFYSRRSLASGGTLYADITTGYGPECFTIRNPKAYDYKLKAHYYSRGPMGYGAGKVQVIRHNGNGGLGIEDRPFVIMQDGAFVDLGIVKKKTAKVWKRAPKAVAKP